MNYRRWNARFEGRHCMSRFLMLTAGLLLASPHLSASAQDRAASPALSVAGGPHGDPYKWFTDLDYPAAARNTGAGGKVSVMLSIDTNGRVDGCRVTASSGNSALDEMTCWLVQRRGRFIVQKDASGNPERYTFALHDVPWHPPSR
jgi:protein TonB